MAEKDFKSTFHTDVPEVDYDESYITQGEIDKSEFHYEYDTRPQPTYWEGLVDAAVDNYNYGEVVGDFQQSLINEAKASAAGLLEPELIEPKEAKELYDIDIDEPTALGKVKSYADFKKERTAIEREAGTHYDWRKHPLRSLTSFLAMAVGSYSTTEFLADVAITKPQPALVHLPVRDLKPVKWPVLLRTPRLPQTCLRNFRLVKK